MKMGIILALVLISAIEANSAFATPFVLKNMTAEYTVKYDGIPIGNSSTMLRVTKNQYSLCIDNKTTIPFLKGFVKECSEGLIEKNDIKPLHYNYFYQQDKDKQSLQIDFDWRQHIATITTNKTHWRLNFPPHTQDKISYQLLLRQLLSINQKNFSFPVADGGKIKTYQFKVVNTENLITPWKTFKTIKLDRLPIPNKEDVSLWFIPDYDYIVAKAEQKKHIINIGTAEIKDAQI